MMSHMLRYIDILNKLPLVDDGFIYLNYCIGSGCNRRYFSDHNGQKIDTIRLKIEGWFTSGYINEDMYYFLLTSLVESADKVANTASIYGAFLKQLKKSAIKKLVIEPAHYINTENSHIIHNVDSNVLISDIKGDILYLDPPYNHRQYSANYHLLNTITKYDVFVPKGITGLRDYNRSSYCKKSEATRSLEDLISKAKFTYIFLSYNNEGLISVSDICEMMSKHGEYKMVTRKYQRFKADSNLNRNHKATYTTEYIHILKKESNE